MPITLPRSQLDRAAADQMAYRIRQKRPGTICTTLTRDNQPIYFIGTKEELHRVHPTHHPG